MAHHFPRAWRENRLWETRAREHQTPAVCAPRDMAELLEGDWKVDKILWLKPMRQGIYALVRWVGFYATGDTWEPVEHVKLCTRRSPPSASPKSKSQHQKPETKNPHPPGALRF